MTETIFALATAPGRAAVAVVRISGPEAGPLLSALSGRLPDPRRASLATLRTVEGVQLDQALVLWLPGPGSFTGEDSAELHLHGGTAVVDAVMAELARRGGRLAEPGEFTRRAFQAGKLDLSQAEAVADLVDAETEAQRRQALAQLGGALAERHQSWRDALIEVLALLEAEIDFPDEDVPDAIAQAAGPLIDDLLASIEAALDKAERGEQIRTGYRVAIIGAPNAGKSSLRNALAERDAAIVTPIAGTTRDVIEVPRVLAGYKVLFADTAGIHASDDQIEAEGIRRARLWAASAALRVLVVDASATHEAPPDVAAETRAGDILVMNKVDLRPGPAADSPSGLETVRLSARTGDGVSSLVGLITERVVAALGSAEEFPAATRLRHQALLASAAAALQRARTALAVGAELAAAECHLAAQALERISGRVGSDDVLDQVFARFCIGK